MTQEESRPAVTGALSSEGASQETGSGLNQCGICEGTGRLVRTLERGEVSSDCGNCGGAGVLPARPAVEEGPRDWFEKARELRDALRRVEETTCDADFCGHTLDRHVKNAVGDESYCQDCHIQGGVAQKPRHAFAARPLVQEDDPALEPAQEVCRRCGHMRAFHAGDGACGVTRWRSRTPCSCDRFEVGPEALRIYEEELVVASIPLDVNPPADDPRDEDDDVLKAFDMLMASQYVVYDDGNVAHIALPSQEAVDEVRAAIERRRGVAHDIQPRNVLSESWSDSTAAGVAVPDAGHNQPPLAVQAGGGDE